MNEGWATYWHYTLLNTLYDEGKLSDGFMFEFLQSHTNVVHQPPYNSQWYSGDQPLRLGFAMWRDIRRICAEPTAEDREWFPDIAGSDRREAFDFAMKNFKDESFVAQYLSPKLMRDFRFFAIQDDDSKPKLRSTPSTTSRVPRGTAAPRRAVQPGQRTQHPGVECRSARRPVADPAAL